MKKRVFIIILLLGIIAVQAKAQQKKAAFKDTLDGKFDMSDWVVNLHGFVPWPTIITEPALGSFGIGFAAVFMSPKKTAKPGEQFHFPDITAVAGMWTLNNTWGAGIFRQGSFPKIGMRYTIGAGYVDANMDYYRTFTFPETPLTPETTKEKAFNFNLKPVVAVLDISENLFKNKIFAGLRYQYSWTKVHYDFSNQVDSLFVVHAFNPPGFDQQLGTFGIYGEVDTRNTIFTPDRGIRFKTTYTYGRNWTASDVDVDKLEMYVNAYFQLWKPWVCGFKATGIMVNEGVPFYYYPYLDMRGLAMMKYQGQQMLEFETEQRFDVTRRWSLVGFVGTGRTWSDSKFMSDETWHWAGGAGFRYLLARLFKLRMGIDIAASKNQFAYYIVLGHYWNR